MCIRVWFKISTTFLPPIILFWFSDCIFLYRFLSTSTAAGSMSEFVSSLLSKDSKYSSRQKCLESLSFHLLGIFNLCNNKLKSLILPTSIFNFVFFIFWIVFIDVCIISLSSCFIFFDPMISYPIWFLMILSFLSPAFLKAWPL